MTALICARRRYGLLLVSGALLLAGCAGSSSATTTGRTSTPAAATSASASASVATSTTTTPAAKPRRRRHHHHRPNPGTLPQTTTRPSAGTRGFHREMAALWRGVQAGAVGRALPAFFPEGAYAQLKTLGDPQADWRSRLVGDYALDLRAAHALLGAHPAAARLVDVSVPASYAHWVSPGGCDNRIGYWEVPNARVVYRHNGAERSFGIASMISWRGVWYVVHLGAVLRSGVGGVVDDPSSGPGVSAYSGTC